MSSPMDFQHPDAVILHQLASLGDRLLAAAQSLNDNELGCYILRWRAEVVAGYTSLAPEAGVRLGSFPASEEICRYVRSMAPRSNHHQTNIVAASRHWGIVVPDLCRLAAVCALLLGWTSCK